MDDEKNVLRSLKRLFLDSDYEIITAESGDEGLELLRNEDLIQIVISDYRMPGMNGIDFLKEVCERWPDTVRMVLSGYADASAIVGAINEGQIYKFMPKPWNDDELRVTISNALDRYFMHQKNIQLTRELEKKNKELKEAKDNLEDLLKERTFDLMLQKKILTGSQNILDSLPVGVIGVDPEGSIVQCNKRGLELSGNERETIIGTDRQDAFSGEINAFIDRVTREGTFYSCISNNGINLNIKGVHMKGSNGQEGIILVINEETTHV